LKHIKDGAEALSFGSLAPMTRCGRAVQSLLSSFLLFNKKRALQQRPSPPPQLTRPLHCCGSIQFQSKSSMVATRSRAKRNGAVDNDAEAVPSSTHRQRTKKPKHDGSHQVTKAVAPPTNAQPPPVSAPSSSSSAAAASSKNDCIDNILLSLSPDCVQATLICRPSKRNKSPYVADIFVPSLQREAICHVPNLDMGGKCVPGATLWVRPQRDAKTGFLLGPNAVSPKYGTPKCEFVTQLLRVDEGATISHHYGPPVWVGAHPNLGEQIAERMIQQHIQQQNGADDRILPNVGPIQSYQKQVKINAHSRADFVLQPLASDNEKGGQQEPRRPRIVEVKTVVDTDYNPAWGLPDVAASASSSPKRRAKKNSKEEGEEGHAATTPNANKPKSLLKCVFQVPPGSVHDKYGIFPWGQSKQKGPNGEAVVSARAIKHVRELTEMVLAKKSKQQQQYDATILFIVIRHDAQAFRPNHEACPSFSKYLQEAHQAGVQVLAKRVQWGEGEQMGQCLDSGYVDVVFPKPPLDGIS